MICPLTSSFALGCVLVSLAHTSPCDSTQPLPKSRSRQVAMSPAPPTLRRAPSLYSIVIFILCFCLVSSSGASCSVRWANHLTSQKNEKLFFKNIFSAETKKSFTCPRNQCQRGSAGGSLPVPVCVFTPAVDVHESVVDAHAAYKNALFPHLFRHSRQFWDRHFRREIERLKLHVQ